MGDETRTRKQLIAEVEELRRQCALVRAEERIREEVLSMRSSEDIARVVAAMWQEMIGLAIETPAASIAFVEEGTDQFPTYVASENPRRRGVGWTSPLLEEIDDKVVVHLPIERPVLVHIREHLLEVWREQRTESFVEESSFTDLLELMGFEGNYEDWLEEFTGEWSVTNVPFAHGTVGYRERVFVEEHAGIVGELARSLSLGYLRFLDFQRLEERNRELTVERALERVRREVAAMKESRDLRKIADVIRDQLGELGVESEGVGINIIDEESEKFLFPPFSREESDVFDLDTPFKPFVDLYSHWKRGEIFQRFYREGEWKQYVGEMIDSGYATGEDLKNNRDSWFTEERVKPYQDLEWRDYLEQIPTPPNYVDKWVVDIPFSHGTLALNRSGPEPFSDEDLRLMQRFAEVFSLGYVRYLDIREAEEQTRRANRERAAERVRGEAMTMRSSDDLLKVVGVMFQGLLELGLEASTCWIDFSDEETGQVKAYQAMINPRKAGIAWSSPEIVEIDETVVVLTRDLSWERLKGYLPEGEKWASEAVRGERIQNWAKRLADYYGLEDVWPFPGEDGVMVNMRFDYGVIGVIEPGFSEEHVTVLQEFTEALSLGYLRFLDFRNVDEAQRRLIDELEEELQTAREKQMALMPKGAPEVEGIHLSGRCVPANHVGGDFFQYFPREGGRLSVCMADVTGHAMEAAIPVVMFDGVLESQMAMGVGLEELFERLNDLLCAKLDERTFVCFAMGEFDAERRLLRLANGGIPYPLHFHSDSGEITELEVEAYPFGVRPGVDYPIIEVPLEPGDRVVFCSDGLAEAENAEGEIFGFERTGEAVRRGCVDGLSGEELIERLFEEVRAFSGETPQGDDMTCVVLQVEG